MTDGIKNYRTSNEFLAHTTEEGKKTFNYFSSGLIIFYLGLTVVLIIMFFLVIPKVAYDNTEGWMPHLSESWKGYRILLRKNPVLFIMGNVLSAASAGLFATGLISRLCYEKT